MGWVTEVTAWATAWGILIVVCMAWAMADMAIILQRSSSRIMEIVNPMDDAARGAVLSIIPVTITVQIPAQALPGGQPQ